MDETLFLFGIVTIVILVVSVGLILEEENETVLEECMEQCNTLTNDLDEGECKENCILHVCDGCCNTINDDNI